MKLLKYRRNSSWGGGGQRMACSSGRVEGVEGVSKSAGDALSSAKVGAGGGVNGHRR